MQWEHTRKWEDNAEEGKERLTSFECPNAALQKWAKGKRGWIRIPTKWTKNGDENLWEENVNVHNSILFDSHYDRCLEEVKRKRFDGYFFKLKHYRVETKLIIMNPCSKAKNENFDNTEILVSISFSPHLLIMIQLSGLFFLEIEEQNNFQRISPPTLLHLRKNLCSVQYECIDVNVLRIC